MKIVPLVIPPGFRVKHGMVTRYLFQTIPQGSNRLFDCLILIEHGRPGHQHSGAGGDYLRRNLSIDAPIHL